MFEHELAERNSRFGLDQLWISLGQRTADLVSLLQASMLVNLTPNNGTELGYVPYLPWDPLSGR
jgi:hypothetical protein